MKQSKKWMLVALALLAMVIVALPLVGCKNDSVSEPVRYTVTFNTDGGSTVQSQTVESGQKVPEPAEPTRNDYVFVGWYRDEEFTNKYDFTTPVTGSFTLYAGWGTEITSGTVASVIAGLSEGDPHILVATGEWNLSTLAEKLTDENKKVNLDLSKVSGLTTIGRGAFNGCSSLTSITIPASVKTIGDHAFNGCSSLTSITIPASVETIGAHAFEICSSLKSITIPASVKTIGMNAFLQCSSLTTVTFGEESQLKTINLLAFFQCSSLTSITIPASVTTIENDAFNGCSKLTKVTMEATTPPTLSASAFSDTSTGLQILVPSSSVNAYKAGEGWEPYKDKIIEQTS